MEVSLPGGLLENGCVERRARFRKLTGHMESALIELDKNASRPSYVSSVLALALESIGGHTVDVKRVNSLCVADRQFLMLRLAAVLSGEQQWLKVTCRYCKAFFDVDFSRCDLPVKEAAVGFPFIRLNLEAGEAELRVPTASEQMVVAGLPDHEAMQHMLLCCIRSINKAAPADAAIQQLSDADIAAIDQALDSLSPAVCDELLVICPECKREQSAKLDHYHLSGLDSDSFYDEVHTIAMHYHWSETEILNMARSKRHRYLGLIDRSRAMNGQVA
jgi:hypothetical protein